MDYFRKQEVQNICISIQSVTYFQLQFPFLSAFIARLTECEPYSLLILLTSDSSIRNFHQTVTSQYTVNANEQCTYMHFRDHANSECVSPVG